MFVFSKSLKRFKVSFQSVVQLTFVCDYLMKRLQKCTFKVVNQIEPMYSVHKIKLYHHLKTDNFEAQQKKNSFRCRDKYVPNSFFKGSAFFIFSCRIRLSISLDFFNIKSSSVFCTCHCSFTLSKRI